MAATIKDGQPAQQTTAPAAGGFTTPEQRPKAIDLNEEARKLASLKEKRTSLARQAEKVIAACKAQYPE